jgi:hypothetical protein
MWYDGRKDFPLGAPVQNVSTSPASQRCVGFAESTDGVHWKRVQKEPVLRGDAGAVDVQRIGDQLYLLYESRDGVRFAVGDDGLHWTDRGLFVAKSGKSIDAFGCVTPFLSVDPAGKSHRLYYGAAEAPTWDRNAIVSTPIAGALATNR